MKCAHCGYEQPNPFVYCPACGKAIAQDEIVSAQAVQTAASQSVLKMLQNKLFLAICILVSASTVLSLSSDGLPLLSILMSVFLWLTFAQSRSGIANPQHMRCISGTIYAEYVIAWVASILLAVCGGIFALASGFISGNQAIKDQLMLELPELMGDSAFIIEWLVVSGMGILAFLILALAVGSALINIFGLRSVHRFARSVYRSVLSGDLRLEKQQAAKSWAIVFGVFSAISALTNLSNVTAALSEGCIAAAWFIGSHLIRQLSDSAPLSAETV